MGRFQPGQFNLAVHPRQPSRRRSCGDQLQALLWVVVGRRASAPSLAPCTVPAYCSSVCSDILLGCVAGELGPVGMYSHPARCINVCERGAEEKHWL